MVNIFVYFIIIYIIYNCGYTIIENIKSLNCFDKNKNKVVNRNIDIKDCRKFNNCNKIFPDTYFIKNKNEMQQLKTKYNKSNWFILKKIWGEQRNGLKLKKYTDNVEDYNYDQVQQLIDSLKINNRIFHIRMYLIIDCDKGIYLYKNGLLIFCKQQFNINNVNNNNIITGNLHSGVQNSSFYIKNNLPKDLFEFYRYLDNNGMSSNLFMIKLIELFKNYIKTKTFCNKIDGKLCKKIKHIYGPDIIVTKYGIPIILEVNQSPDLNSRRTGEIQWQSKIKKELLSHYLENDYSSNLFHKI